MSKQLCVNKVAILGAGVMGAQIAAHFGNANVPVVLFDLKSNENDHNGLINKSLDNLKKLNPKPLATLKSLDYITPANYDDDLELLKDCGLIIEAIAERIDLKETLYHKIAPHVNSRAIIASNTSGLSIELLAGSLPAQLRAQYCGIHFFNPPRYMPLVELIPHTGTTPSILDDLESFLVKNLGKSIVRAKDTPNFIANRLGVFSMLTTCIHAEKFNIPLEVVDNLTGKNLGRAKSATFRTADVVGLDTFAHVVNTMATGCKDAWQEYYKLPQWMEQLVKNGSLGQKTKAGCYKKEKDGIYVLDTATSKYRISDKKADKEVLEMLREKDWAKKLKSLRESQHPQAQFLWACFCDMFHYAATMVGDISDTPRDMDLAIRWGFGWKEGIFEIWQQAGWADIASAVNDAIKAKQTLATSLLPEWVHKLANGVYYNNLHFDIKAGKLVIREMLPVYKRQIFPDLVVNEVPDVTREVLYENAGVTLWHTGDNIGILSFKSKMCAIGMDVLVGLEGALAVAEEKCDAMVIWQQQDIFSVGANLEEFGFAIMMNGEAAVEETISRGHEIITQKLRYSKIPVIAAVRGYVLGGGCEIMLHSSAVVAALESYIGLIEAGVGLLPGWGGSTEMAYRASLAIDPWKDFEKRYRNLAMAQVATSAKEAMEMGFLKETDTIVMNSKEVLYVAKAKAKYMANIGYQPPVRPKFAVFGKQGIATVNGLLANMYAGAQISAHDLFIAKNLATVMCGGELESGSVVNQDWLLKIEKDRFKELALSKKTEERIQYMLENGKPLRN